MMYNPQIPLISVIFQWQRSILHSHTITNMQRRCESFVDTATIQKQPSHGRLSSCQHTHSDGILH